MDKCQECGANDFYVSEQTGYKAHVANGVLVCKVNFNEVDAVTCRECNEVYSPSEFDEYEY